MASGSIGPRPSQALEAGLILLLFGLGLSVTLADLGFLLITGAALWGLVRGKLPLRLTSLGTLALLLLLIYGIAGLFSPLGPGHFWIGIREARPLLLIPLLSAFSWKEERWKRAGIALLLGVGLGGLIGLVEATHFYGYLRTVGISKLNYFLTTFARVQGPYTTYMTFGEVQAMTAVWAAALFPYLPALTGPVALVGSLGAWLSLTRMTWLAWSAGIAGLAFLRRPFFLLGSLVVFAAAWAIASGGMRYRARDLLRLEATFHRSRFPIWEVAIAALRERPLTGWGEGSAPTLFRRFPKPGGKVLPYKHFHSNLLHIAVVAGIPGGLLYLIWAGIIFSRFRRLRRVSSDSDRLFLLGALLAALVFHITGLTEYTFGDAEVAYLHAALVGMMESLCRAD